MVVDDCLKTVSFTQYFSSSENGGLYQEAGRRLGSTNLHGCQHLPPGCHDRHHAHAMSNGRQPPLQAAG